MASVTRVYLELLVGYYSTFAIETQVLDHCEDYCMLFETFPGDDLKYRNHDNPTVHAFQLIDRHFCDTYGVSFLS